MCCAGAGNAKAGCNCGFDLGGAAVLTISNLLRISKSDVLK